MRNSILQTIPSMCGCVMDVLLLIINTVRLWCIFAVWTPRCLFDGWFMKRMGVSGSEPSRGTNLATRRPVIVMWVLLVVQCFRISLCSLGTFELMRPGRFLLNFFINADVRSSKAEFQAICFDARTF